MSTDGSGETIGDLIATDKSSETTEGDAIAAAQLAAEESATATATRISNDTALVSALTVLGPSFSPDALMVYVADTTNPRGFSVITPAAASTPVPGPTPPPTPPATS